MASLAMPEVPNHTPHEPCRGPACQQRSEAPPLIPPTTSSSLDESLLKIGDSLALCVSDSCDIRAPGDVDPLASGLAEDIFHPPRS